MIEPIITQTLITDTYSCIKKRGVHLAGKRTYYMIRQSDAQYVLKLDIKKFFPSVDHGVMKQALRKKIKDPDLLWLLDEIIDSTNGLPIGLYTSQLWSNLYLSGLDHFIKETLKIKYYIRYCDDMVIFHSDKKHLQVILDQIQEYLLGIHLELNRKSRIFPAIKGVDFLGWVFYPSHVRLRKSIKKRFAMAYKRLINHPTCHNYCSVASYWSYLKYCDSRFLIKKIAA